MDERFDRVSAAGERHSHRIDQKRRVGRNQLDHRSRPLVAVRGTQRVESPDQDIAALADPSEVEQSLDLGAYLFFGQEFEVVAGDPSEVCPSEGLE